MLRISPQTLAFLLHHPRSAPVSFQVLFLTARSPSHSSDDVVNKYCQLITNFKRIFHRTSIRYLRNVGLTQIHYEVSEVDKYEKIKVPSFAPESHHKPIPACEWPLQISFSKPQNSPHISSKDPF